MPMRMASTKLHRGPHGVVSQFAMSNAKNSQINETQFVAESRLFSICDTVRLKYYKKQPSKNNNNNRQN